MLLKQFTLVHHYPESTSLLSVSMASLRRKCKLLSPQAVEPKLGDHTTLLPPFRAHPDEMRQFSMGLNIAHALYGEEDGKNFAETQNIEFFRNQGIDACVVKILLPPKYHSMIDECRKQLSRFNEWVFPLEGSTYKPHICVLEGPGLYEDLRPKLLELDDAIFIVRFNLSFPKIMVKITENGSTRWEEFNPKE